MSHHSQFSPSCGRPVYMYVCHRMLVSSIFGLFFSSTQVGKMFLLAPVGTLKEQASLTLLPFFPICDTFVFFFDPPRYTPNYLPTMTPTPFFSHLSIVFYVFYFCVYVLAARRLVFPYCCFPLVHVSCSSPRRLCLFTRFCTFSLQLSEKIAACVRESAALKEKQVSEPF